MPSVFGLVDCNNFFVSCERVFNPDLNHRPVIVLSNNDGCVISRSNEAKALGIPMGEAFFKIKDLCARRDVRVYSGNFALYGDMSRRVMSIMEGYTRHLEVYSIDEAFLDWTDLAPACRSDYAKEMRSTILRWTGIPVSIGIAPTRTLAKIGSELAKKNPQKSGGVVDLSNPRYVEQALLRTPVKDVWGVGWRLAPDLEARGIRTARDLRDADDRWILQHYTVTLMRTVLELRGTVCYPLATWQEPRKTVICSRSFGNRVTDCASLEQAVSTFTAQAAQRLREDGMLARQVSVSIRTSFFIAAAERYHQSLSAVLPVPTDCTTDLNQVALELTRRLYADGYEYYKASVVLHDLVPAEARQLDLLEVRDTGKLRRLMGVLDALNVSLGTGTLKYATEGLEKPWWMNHQYRSRRFTTHWGELPGVSAISGQAIGS